MASTGQNDRRKNVRRERNRRKADTRTIKTERKDEKEQEVMVRHESAAPPAKEKSAWSWHQEHEEFAVVWSETFITKKKGKNPKKGE